MATIREYFDKESSRVLCAIRTVKLSHPTGNLDILVAVHYDFDAPAKYLSVFISSSEHLFNICKCLLLITEFLLKSEGDVNVRLPVGSAVYGGFYVANHPGNLILNATPLCEPEIAGETLPFTGTIFFYSENELSEVELALLKNEGKQKTLTVRWRGPRFARERSLIEKPVAFISHDSRDKEEVARPLAIRLQQLACPVWFDEFSLRVGDSLRDKVEKGLKETAKCVVVLSPHFLGNKRWTKVEFDSVFTREIIEETNVILPVWHNVTVKDVYEYSPSLANRLAVDWKLGIEEVARRLYQKISDSTTLPSQNEWHRR